MASNYKNSVARRNAALDAMTVRLSNGTIAIRTGSPPTNVTDASSGTLLGTLTYGGSPFAAASSGSATANAITSDTNADASGDAGYFREFGNGAADTACEAQGTAGEAADTPDLTFDNKTIVSGGTIAITSLTLSMPEQ